MKFEEAKEKLHNIAYRDLQTKPYDLKLADVIQILNQIKLDKPKPEVPQMIFDVIKSFDDDVDYLHQHMSRQSDEVREWLTHNEREFYEAWLAYPNITIEKEKLYTVEIPNPNSDLKIILVKVNKKLKLIEAYEDQLEEYKNIRNVTESEIRKDFDWAWQFRKDVENE
ncbi:hypothetical protein AX265_09835 [Streptococcus agalactiae]|uniref:DUF1642 domain-containing protein n=1 Tax=Streptococcus agalactiae TaxID=1311 RepID=UPI000810A839|nr:DUF1642 domain-containing protein [Streptococcus agalactiae]OCL63111.1 hypothetical protein AX265_09835 [Streptococcus agalactiae]